MNMTSFTPCRICVKKPGPFPGYYYVTSSEGRRSVVECACHKLWDSKQTLERKLLAANLWTDQDYDPDRHYKGTKSQDEVDCIKKYVTQFDKRFADKMIYMYGVNGTQKTTLAMWAGRELIKRGKSVYYSLMENLSIALSPDFKAEDDSRQRVVDKALNSDLLIVDESFDRSKMTLYKSGYQIPFIDSFIRNRFDINKKAIIFISNKPASSLAENGFGESLQSLVARNTRESTLIFRDEYIKEANDFDPKGLFK